MVTPNAAQSSEANTSSQTQNESVVGHAVAQGGAYDVIRKRLEEHSKALEDKTRALNDQRLAEFGSSEMSVAARVRVRTENNCIARDMVQVGEYLLFGYNVFIGLKKETHIADVFAVFTLANQDGSLDLHEVNPEKTFLSDSRFITEFTELYRYYKNAKLLELTVKDGKLLMGFQIGERLEDIRVFRWAISADGKQVEYIDNRGERDIQLPPNYDFEWITCTREDAVHGRHAHMNILDKIFVETIGGDLTIKVENNTEDGLGIYREEVEDKTQSLDDAEYGYAQLGDLILLKVLPYRENDWRYFIFNTITSSVLRIDAIGASCVQLPEDHGVVFPGGYYLQNGDYKTFDQKADALRFKRMIRSPNGEDVLYVFYEPEEGLIGLFAYNMIEKTLQNPIFGHGYALSDSGQLVIFSAESEPTRTHPMQIWETPYVSDEFASQAPASQTFLGKIGNASLVRGISDLLSLCRTIENQSVSANLYEELSRAALKIFDDHYWVDDTSQNIESLSATPTLLRDISAAAELAVDEFSKVESIRAQSSKAITDAKIKHTSLVESVQGASWEAAEEYVNALDALRQHAGLLATIKSYRYIDVDEISGMEATLKKVQETLSERTAEFLAKDDALQPYYGKIDTFTQELNDVETIAALSPLIEQIDKTAIGLDLLSELLANLKVADTTLRTRIVDAISEVYAKLNQIKAKANHKKKNLGSEEAIAQFAAQFKLFTQSITNALGQANSPEACDEQMSRLLIQLEELESQFSDYDQFLSDIMSKREEVYESFESQKQRLLDDRERRAQSIAEAAQRILNSIEKRANKFTEAEKLNTYFASDALVLKSREFVEQLRELNAQVKADDIEAKFKAIVEQGLRSLRDKTDIFEEGGTVIKLGPRHKFSVNTQELDLTILPRNNQLTVHLTGTDFFEPLDDATLNELRDYWNVSLESENENVYRAEYLAASILNSANTGIDDLTNASLQHALLDDADLLKLVRDYATPRYKEGYQKGIHDHDAKEILKQLVPAIEAADLLVYDPKSRALAQVFWANIQRISEQLKNKRLSYDTWRERAQSAAEMHHYFTSSSAKELLVDDVLRAMQEFLTIHPIAVDALDVRRAADYLVSELGRERVAFIGSKYAQRLATELKQSLSDEGWRRFQLALEKMMGWPAERWNLSCAWLAALVKDKNMPLLTRYIPEAAALINADERIDRRYTETDLELRIDGLLGDHTRIDKQVLTVSVDEFLLRTEYHRSIFIENYRKYLHTRQDVIDRERKKLRLNEFKPKPLSSFVRNRLINEAYLPIIGDNLAKQMGTIGDTKRTDLMGMLMMISPPGYGKTTLMEYVASRLGLIFMKINCPSLGHDVLSLDPAQAPNATAKQELIKLNLALEMGNNVMLYLDDIQHTNPEFLQKFISLCDGTRRIDGIWRDTTKTYDMRGKKFCVVMAGNPYTETGEAFKIPDMLSNRADIYNLGDILGGMDEQFAMSYIENSLTSNSVLAPLATRDIKDVYLLIKLAEGKDIATTDLSYQYSGAEINEITDVLKKLFVIRDVILKINQQYIVSAAQADKYRTEPAFKLQGSYRNMNKMGEKVSSVMNQAELMQLIEDHYLGEAQLLTGNAEENLLKLAELRGNMTQEQTGRWVQIKADFMRNKAMGGDEADTGMKIVGQLVDLVDGVKDLHSSARERSEKEVDSRSQSTKSANKDSQLVVKALLKMSDDIQSLVSQNVHQEAPHVEVINQPVPGIDKLLHVLAQTIENSIFPLVRSMDKKLEIDLRTHDKMLDVSNQLRELERELKGSQPKNSNK